MLLVSNSTLDKYIDTAYYRRFFGALPYERRASFEHFAKRCFSEFEKHDLNEYEYQVVSFLLLRHYFML